MEEAYRHKQLLRMTEDHFTSWGYLPVHTPVFDFFETYRHLLSSGQEEQSYRFPDRDGELLMLRSDITLFLAKQMGIASASEEHVRRVYYADSILRHQDEEDVSSNEFFQSGAELIGKTGRDGDLELLMLLHDLLRAMKLPKWRMHIGSRAVMDAVLAGKANPARAGELLELRDARALTRLLTDSGFPSGEARAELLLFLGTPAQFARQAGPLTGACGPENEIQDIKAAVKELSSLAAELSQTASEEALRIDLSEHGGQPYYTGFTVKAYTEGANTAIASGGRYDELLGAFGPAAPAAGFSLMMRKIEPLSLYAAEAAESRPIENAAGENFAQLYTDAVSRRRDGSRITLSSASQRESG